MKSVNIESHGTLGAHNAALMRARVEKCINFIMFARIRSAWMCVRVYLTVGDAEEQQIEVTRERWVVCLPD
jgi:hypothetical protein